MDPPTQNVVSAGAVPGGGAALNHEPNDLSVSMGENTPAN